MFIYFLLLIDCVKIVRNCTNLYEGEQSLGKGVGAWGENRKTCRRGSYLLNLKLDSKTADGKFIIDLHRVNSKVQDRNRI